MTAPSTASAITSGSALPSTSDAQRDLVNDLRAAVAGRVDDGKRRRAEYSTDASNYRVVPEVVIFPRDVDDIVAAAAIARDHQSPLTVRGGGTSVAGNSIGPGIVMDLSRSVNRVLEIDPEALTARVEPGLILGSLQKAAAPHGLRFGPDPSTWARATLGGMIGNNACGSHSLAFGKTSDNVLELDMIDGLGRRVTASSSGGSTPVEGLDAFVAANLALFRTELGRFGRQVSGYSLEHLLPENGRNLAKALVGTEGTCGIVLGATVQLVEVPTDPYLVVLGYPSMFAAADAVPAILPHKPGSIEGLDARLVNAVRRHRGAAATSALPKGAGWLLVEISGPDRRESLDRAEKLVVASGAISSRIMEAGPDTRAIIRIREDGAGLAGRTEAGRQAWPGFEDAAVPPENLGLYLRDFDELMQGHGIDGMPYGHFGDGCIHIRLDVPLDRNGESLRSFMEDAARLVARHGGSLSGEHGDGRARSELLPLMYSPELIQAFAGFKHLFDPQNLLNPGVVVAPAKLDADLRRPSALPIVRVNGFSFENDGGDFTAAMHRCVGVGKCRVDNTASGGFMCPSFIATADEKDSTRGRARVLQEMANGTLIGRDWRAPEIHDALDLCLSCKACSSDCPAGVDMATYKAEVLHRAYEGRLRPITHYVLGWLPRWARLTSPIAPLANAVLSVRPIQKAVLWLGGMDTRRTMPPFAPRSFRSLDKKRRAAAERNSRPVATPIAPLSPTSADGRTRVMLWTDSFSDNFDPGIATAALAVLESAGYEVLTPSTPVCCGLTWISTGQLTGAKRRLSALLDEFAPIAAAGIPIIGLEPSCTAVLRGDLRELLSEDPRSALVAESTRTLAELLSAPEPLGPGAQWTPPRLDDVNIIVQPHCHQHAVMGFSPDAALLKSLGASLVQLSGCCGLAGNFGMERGHYDVSVAVAENALLPALREAKPGDIFLADGFSCRTQADQLAGVSGQHLAELLASRLPSSLARE